MVNDMLMNNNFSKRNSLLYKSKCLNCRNEEYKSLEKEEYGRVEKFDDSIKKK